MKHEIGALKIESLAKTIRISEKDPTSHIYVGENYLKKRGEWMKNFDTKMGGHLIVL